MNSLRMAIFRCLFWLPTALVIAVFFAFLFSQVKPYAADAPKRIGREYRELVEDFMDHPERATFVGKRQHGSGWRQSGRIDGVAYGHVRDGNEELIWFERERGNCHAMKVKPLSAAPIMAYYIAGGSVVILLMIMLSLAAEYWFRRYLQDRDDFLAAIAHDLTSPLAAMKLSIGTDDDSVLVLCDRIMRIVGNIKSFLRLGGKMAPSERVQFNLLTAFKEAYELFRFEYQDVFGGEDIPVDCRTDATVVGDMTMTVQILWNLLGNDLKYAAPYGLVKASFSSGNGKVRLELIDEGPGMSAKQRRRVFNRYYRADNAKESGKSGFGIGLSTSREMARLMGGDITLRANGAHGCIFTLIMPAAAQMG